MQKIMQEGFLAVGEQLYRDLCCVILNANCQSGYCCRKTILKFSVPKHHKSAVKMIRQFRRSMFDKWNFWRSFPPAPFFWLGKLPSYSQFSSLKRCPFLFLPTFFSQSFFFFFNLSWCLVCVHSFIQQNSYGTILSVRYCPEDTVMNKTENVLLTWNLDSKSRRHTVIK